MLIYKRLLYKSSFTVMLALTFLSILLCGSLSTDDGIPACGVVLGNDSMAKDLGKQLVEDGLVTYDDETALRKAIKRGEVSMGAILPHDLTARLETGNTSGMISFVESPSSVLQPIYRYRISAYLLEAYTPYLTSSLLQEAGVKRTPDEMRVEIDAYLANEATFTFTFSSITGTPAASEHYSFQLCAGVAALFLFFAFGLFACPYTNRQLAAIMRRVGVSRTFFAFALPSILAVLTLFAVAVASALWLTDMLFQNGAAVLIPAALIYTVFLSALGVLLTAVFGNTDRLRIPMFILCLFSLGFCPIFADLPALLNIPTWPKVFLPPTFFYTAIEHPFLCAATAIAGFAAAILFYFATAKKRILHANY